MKIYLDTNIFDNLIKDDDRTQITKKLFLEIEEGKFEAFCSRTVVEEILRTEDKEQKLKLKVVPEEKIIQKRCVKLVPIDGQNSSKIYNLDDAYQIVWRKMIKKSNGTKLVWGKSIFSKPGSQTEDRRHIAIAVINKLDIFVTWDMELMQQDIKNWINKINRKLGYLDIEIYSPTDLLRISSLA